MVNVLNRSPYLRGSRDFPEDLYQLAFEVDKAYLEIAQAVNLRTIGTFPTNRSVLTGEQWYLFRNQKQEGLRQVYNLTNFNPLNHNLNFDSISTFTKISGIGFDGTNYFPLPYVTAAIPNGNVGMYLNSSQVIFTTGAGSPVIVSGILVLEWISNV